jgi:hypothetical protein
MIPRTCIQTVVMCEPESKTQTFILCAEVSLYVGIEIPVLENFLMGILKLYSVGLWPQLLKVLVGCYGDLKILDLALR